MRAIIAFIAIAAGVAFVLMMFHPNGITVDPPEFNVPKVQIVSQP